MGARSDMTGRRRGTAILLLAAYMATGIVMGVIHHDVFAFRLTSDPAITPHTCGAHENHIPLDSVQGCAICSQISQRIATPATVISLPSLTTVFVGRVPLGRPEIPFVSPHCSGSRGPPVA